MRPVMLMTHTAGSRTRAFLPGGNEVAILGHETVMLMIHAASSRTRAFLPGGNEVAILGHETVMRSRLQNHRRAGTPVGSRQECLLYLLHLH
jgi:hypothetical protein